MLDLIYAGVDHDDALLDLDLLLHQLNDLLLQKCLLVDVHSLEFPEISLYVNDVFHDLLEGVVGGLNGTVLEGGQLRPQQLHIFLVLVQMRAKVLNLHLKRTFTIRNQKVTETASEGPGESLQQEYHLPRHS